MKTTIKNLEAEIKALKNADLDTTQLEASLKKFKSQYKQSLTPWDKVEIVRDLSRFNSIDIINEICDDFMEFSGDRNYGDDKAIIGGIGTINDNPVTVIGILKGKDANANIESNFGMVHPEGYRKALRLMKQAEKFKRPIITLIDTPGAYPGIGAEARGQAEAIARNLAEMMDLKVLTIAIIIGEAGSGGALALAVGSEVWMFENAVYSILSPEGFASILFKDASKAKEVAGIMKITADDLYNLNVIDEIISEAEDIKVIGRDLKTKIVETIQKYQKYKGSKIKRDRYLKFRNMGEIIHER